MDIKIKVPCGQFGNWKVEFFTVSKSEAEFHNLQEDLSFRRQRYIKPGEYQKLMHKDKIIMSNTPAEISDFQCFLQSATGVILINGLGLGVLLTGVLQKKEITKVIVIELSKDVINLVAPTFRNDSRVKIINANALTWKSPKGERYDCVWHDIWSDINSDNLHEMISLHRKYGKKTANQASWCRAECEIARN